MTTPDPPTKRLHLVEALDHVEVLLPPDLTAARILYGAVFVMTVLATGVATMVQVDDAFKLVAVFIALGVLGLIAWGVGKVLGQYLRWMSRRRPLGAALTTLVAAGLFLLMLAPTAPLTPMLVALALSSGLVYGGLFAWLASAPARLRLGQATLDMRRGRQHWSRPLESITSVSRATGFGRTVTVDDLVVPGGGELSEGEFEWLRDVILEQAERRRSALRAAGVDPEVDAAPPRELLARLERSPDG